MHLQSLRVHGKAPGGARSIWKYFEALVRATGVSGRYVYGFWTELHFADVWPPSWHTHSRQVHLQSRSMMFGKLTRS